MLLFIYRYIIGYLYVKVNSKNPEKLLNLCNAKSVGIWGVKLYKSELYFKIGIKSFKKLRIYKRNASGKVHITKKVGIPFFLMKNKYRYGIIVGAVLFFIILKFMSGFVWNICISGNETVKNEVIIEALEKIGIKEGTKISKIHPGDKRNELLLECDKLSWAAINIEGSKLTVDVSEKKPGIVSDTTPSNLIASCDGVIKKVETISGSSEVKVGEAVKKGDLLVSGLVEYSDMTSSFVRARGKIIAEVTGEFSYEQPLKVVENRKTGTVIKHNVLDLYGIKIPLFLGKVNKPCIGECINRSPSNGKPYVPINIIKGRFSLTSAENIVLSRDEAEKRAKKGIDNLIEKEFESSEIISRNDSVKVLGDRVIIKSEVKGKKNIASEEKIMVDTRN